MAQAKGRGEAMEEWLFANQPQLTPDLVKWAVRSVGGVTDFDTQYPTGPRVVKSDIAMGAALQVHATPTFFINGVRIPMVKPEYFDQGDCVRAEALSWRELKFGPTAGAGSAGPTSVGPGPGT